MSLLVPPPLRALLYAASSLPQTNKTPLAVIPPPTLSPSESLTQNVSIEKTLQNVKQTVVQINTIADSQACSTPAPFPAVPHALSPATLAVPQYHRDSPHLTSSA